MRKKDLANTYNINNPQNYEEKINKDIETYIDTDENEKLVHKNMEFVQVYKTYQAELMELSVDNGLARAILDLMALRMETNNTYIVSQQDLSHVFHKDLRTIRRAVKLLKDRDFITIFKVGRENVYFINPRIFCQVSAGYKEKLIEEYVKINAENDYRTIRTNGINISALADTKERLVLKRDSVQRYQALNRPTNQQIHKMNEVKAIISNLPDEQFSFLKQLDIDKKPLSDKEIQKMKEETQQRKKAIKASKELLKTFQDEQEIRYQVDSLKEKAVSEENTVKASGNLDFKIPDEFYKYDENDPFGLMQDVENYHPLDYISNDEEY